MAIQITVFFVTLVFLCIFFFILGSHSNKSRVSDDTDSIEKLKNGVGESSDINTELANNSRDRRELTEEIEQHNTNAGSGIDEALRILERAKDRNDT